jgi:hypothetical protein
MNDSKKWIKRMFGYEKAFRAKERRILSQGAECGRCGCVNMGELYLLDDAILCGLCAVAQGKMFWNEWSKLRKF